MDVGGRATHGTPAEYVVIKDENLIVIPVVIKPETSHQI